MIASIDHLVLTVRDEAATVRFYTALGMEARRFGTGRLALHFGTQKLNIHVAGSEFSPHAATPAPGSADLCFLLDCPLEQARQRLLAAGVAVELGPVARTGATGPIRSLYCRDPDGNLVELAEAGPA